MRDKQNHLDKIVKYFNQGKTKTKIQQTMSGYEVNVKEFNDYIDELFEEGRITKEQLQKKL